MAKTETVQAAWHQLIAGGSVGRAMELIDETPILHKIETEEDLPMYNESPGDS